jgi:predicted AAA+ superfamily ATPase
MIFDRDILQTLQEWKRKKSRKPLIIRGARQVGKTTLIKKFAESYKQKIFLNLEVADDLLFFNMFDEVKTLLEALFLSRQIPFDAISETLLFIDEIQESPESIKILRYFYEDFPELHVITAGSLLEFAMRKIEGFPVGRVEYLYLHPLNFREYLSAINNELAVEKLDRIPVETCSHPTLLKMFNRYAVLGGMPEVIAAYAETNTILALQSIYESIWESYKADVEKYSANETERKVIKHVIETAPYFLDKRIKFQNFGRSNYRSREVGEAMRNLEDAKICRLIYPTTDLEFPVVASINKSPRLQFLDTGLVNHALGIQHELVRMKDLSNSFKGALIPHLITQEIISLNIFIDKKPNFWVREKKQSSSEVDLVYIYNEKVIPIEIKSGPKGTLRSLHQFVENAKHPFAIRMYAGELMVEKAKTPTGKPYLLLNLPYYLGTKIPEYIDWFANSFTHLL